jgi:cation:H+ antiporter
MDLLIIPLFLLSFVLILASCEFFTNAVEWTGRRFELSEGAVGSVLAAVGTALPETLIPLIAILFIGGSAGEEIGTGAILGAPFMLATLALFVCGMAVLIFRKRRQTRSLSINGCLIRRDIKFFLIAYSLAAFAAFLPTDFNWFRLVLGVMLIPFYGLYLWYTLKTGDSCSEDLKDLYCYVGAKRIKRKSKPQSFVDPASTGIDKLLNRNEPATWMIIFQLVASLVGIIAGATLFVDQIKLIAIAGNINPLVLALLIAPIATELPEKFNSFLWIRAKKDTYALGNITGAMVFQSCFPVSIGLLLTNWHIELNTGDPNQVLEAAAIGIAILSGIILYARSTHKEIKMSGLMIGGVLYAIFLALVLLSV